MTGTDRKRWSAGAAWPFAGRPAAGALLLAGLALAYVGAARAGFLLALVNPVVTPVWLPTGIAIAAVLLLGPRAWPGVALGAFVANASSGVAWAPALAIAAGNTLEAVVAGALVRRVVGDEHPLGSARAVIAFFGLGALASPVVSATVGTTTLVLAGVETGASFAPVWFTWWLGDVGGAVVAAPLILAWLHPARAAATPRELRALAALLALLAILASIIFLDLLPPWARPFGEGFVVIPVVLAAAYAFGQRGATTATFVVAAFAVVGTSAGLGPLVRDTPNTGLLLVQIYIATVALTAMTLAAVVAERRGTEQAVRRLNDELERRVRDRTAALATAYGEVESFSYSVSHDLKAPLRGIDYFSGLLASRHASTLDDEGRDAVARLRGESRRLGALVNDLLALSGVARQDLAREPIDLSAMAREVQTDLTRADPERRAEWAIEEGVRARGDPKLVRVVLDNLLGNAWKFTSKTAEPRIAFGAVPHGTGVAYYVRDNGAGFDAARADGLFTAFRRFHAPSEFGGTGIGLATVKRIVDRHGGRVWAESAMGKGATFYFTVGGEGA